MNMLNQVWVLILRELSSWWYSSVLYSHCVLFSFFSLAAMFLLGGFMEVNEAELSYSFFRWIPWVFAMTTPVIGIRSWSEESHCGLFEVMGTQPIQMGTLVLAKACAAFGVVAFSLFLTAPAVVTVMWLGNPDLGVIVSGYLGSLLCGCAFASVSLAVCAFMRGSIGAFVCSVALCLVLITSGVTRVANIILSSFPSLEWMTDCLAAISITPKFDPFIEGRIELAGLLGFLLLSIVALAICQRALLIQRGSRTRGTWLSRALTYGFPVWLALSIYALLAVALSVIPGRIDMTEDQRYSLPQAVAEELSGLQREVIVRLFATSHHPEFGFDLVRYERRIREMMEQVVDGSNHRVTFEVLDPSRDAQAARIAATDEVASFSVDQGEPLMFGLVVESLDRKRVFDVIDPERERYFMGDMVQAVLDVGQIERRTIGILSPFTESRSDLLAAEYWTGIQVLKQRYNLRGLSMNSDWSDLDMILLLHQNVKDPGLSNRLESFVQQGGDLVVLADPYSLMAQTFGDSNLAALESSQLPEFIQRRGITLSDNRLVYDFDLATEHVTEEGSASNPAILTLGLGEFNPEHAITAGFDYVHFCCVGALEVAAIDGYESVGLVRTSRAALLADVSIVAEGHTSQLEQTMGQLEPLPFGLPLMVLQTSTNDPNEGRVLVVSDVDWLYGTVAGVEDQSGRIESMNANVGLMQSMIDFLAGERSLHELRIRSLAKRPLDGWDAIRQSLVAPYREPIAELAQEISLLEGNLEQASQARRLATSRNSQGGSQVVALTQALRLKLADLSSVRSQREAEVQSRLNAIKWINVLSTPLLTVLMGVAVTTFRARKCRGGCR
ncbi:MULTISPECIES: Gldg family protein [unclassified Lentimonas]|uniref:Gldg family protein n=1 Tax=unclassified Lentimonas TaxID=2630993 RepID=UPI00132AA97D|nr:MULTISPECIES: Gldg family protein [unclassified Lentimonas]CAA6690696.1 Unannotated [Lentimonas sp. CC19]CAA6693362.1 Unannotated [Lentimonas sp. CC10]CAA7071840.1 Unannotated [Lentimonas sp. CC11]